MFDSKIGMNTDPIPDGYRMVSTKELRELYGTWMNKDNIHMPLVNYVSFMMDIVKMMTSYQGIHVCKNPLDLWIFQEIIYERQPNVIIEIGNQAGGSTVFLRDTLFMSVEDAKRVIAIDINRDKRSPLAYPYLDIEWIDGDAVEVFQEVLNLIDKNDRVMIIEDSAHTYENTKSILDNYSNLVTKGQYFIVEDTLMGNILPCRPDQEGAHRAVKEFIDNNDNYRIDRQREKWFITLNPEGYLEKIR